MKKHISLLLLLIFSIQTLVVHADSMMFNPQVRAKVMNQFKQDQYNNIFASKNVFLFEENVNFFETEKKLQTLNQIRLKNEHTKNTIIQEKSQTDTRVYNLEATLELLDKEIEENALEINSLNIQVQSLNAEIKALQEEIAQLKIQIEENRKILVEYLGHIFKKVDINSSENDIDTLKTLLLNSHDLSEILSDIHYSSILEITGHSLVEKHKALVKQMFFKRIELDKSVRDIHNAKKEELVKRKTIVEKREFREKILEFTKGKQSEFNDYIEGKNMLDRQLKLKILQNKLVLRKQKEAVLKKYNCEFINLDSYGEAKDWYLLEQQEKNLDCLTLNKILDSESKLSSIEAQMNPLLWPILPEKGLSAYYKDPEYNNVVGTSHEAIDIRAQQGTEIVAPADGYVTFMRAPIDYGYAYVVLKHADGFVTVYGHVSETLVEPYQFVKAGEVFAKSGGEIGTYGAGYMTTGPHLHFEVFKEREYVDPLDYMDLTILDEEDVPKTQKYTYKFMQDFQNKFGMEYDGDLMKNRKIFTLEGANEQEKQKNLLNTYATPDFRNWDMWVEEGLAARIDPSFLMCIGLSETGLGRNLKTPFNVGNIGNTDSGSTWDFANARQGVHWMAKTLNNKFLGGYNEMNKLSRYGNKTGAIYASSPLNWQNNMVRCLTALKDTYIPDNYNFRVEEYSGDAMNKE